ncbi:S8 family peptidase [Actinomadura rudentiformis]|uniref:S8 family peptidase n=1 Tax=Actinomadura rudentiformis TaxID=359158 RepID=A0A6H9YN59_9ACTN|nr:S8 family peptidase [Actinomadura rudentiformis]KAB2348384.1 S8 family peptidase [Actinomadura rudentiformis]
MRAVPRRLLITGSIAACVGAAAAFPVLAADPDEPLVQVTAAEGTPIPGKYIVTLKSGASTADAAQQVKAAAVERFDGVLNGFAAKLDSAQLEKLRRDSRVAAIEQDQIVKINESGTQRRPLPWGLDRIDQRNRPLSGSFRYNTVARGVHAYVIDTGIDVKHPGFEGRASIVWKAAQYADGTDCNGHGTHVAGIIGSKQYGVAKKVKIRALRVLGCDGTGPMSNVVAAVKWLRNHAAKPSVANISVGGARSRALNIAVFNLSKSGVFVAVAAGNDNKPACNTSPAGAAGVVTVGATNASDRRANFSNYGKCVDIHAPGVGVASTVPGRGREVLDGTSMATPYVAGVAAMFLAGHPKASFTKVERWLKTNATSGRIKGLPTGTPNKLLFKAKL